MSGPKTRSSVRLALQAGLDTLHSGLPERYVLGWRSEFDRRVRHALVSGSAILDVGSGRIPAIAPQARLMACRYVGLDISHSELTSAPINSYDEIVVADVTESVPELHGQFDLVASFQVLEHVKPLAAALENIRAYLRPGGRLIAQMSGTFSLFDIANQCIPQFVSVHLLRLLLRRNPETVFPAHYDRCWYTSLAAELSAWSRAEIVPWWCGASYFSFLRTLQAGYVAYEEWARINGHNNLAPYYIVDAVR